MSFSKVKNLKNFDHSKTSFPLEGKHGKVACSKCHINGFKKKLKFRFCDDCHEDKHSGQLIQKTTITPMAFLTGDFTYFGWYRELIHLGRDVSKGKLIFSLSGDLKKGESCRFADIKVFGHTAEE